MTDIENPAVTTVEENLEHEPLFGGIKLAHDHNEHYIEEAVRVYLMRAVDGTDTWIIDPTCFGESLYSDYDKLQNPECRCERPEECADVLDRMGRSGSLQQFAFFKGSGYATAAHKSPNGRGGDTGVDYAPTASVRRTYVEQRSILDTPLKK